MDGTFRCVPLLYKQFYTILGEVGGFVVPLVFCLLPNKTAETYKTLICRLLGYASILELQLLFYYYYYYVCQFI